MMNTEGPRSDPWGKPHVTLKSEDWLSLILVHWHLLRQTTVLSSK